MEAASLISPDNIIAKLTATSKKQILRELSRRAGTVTGEPERAIFDVLMERERLGTTGIGNGIAIPHGKLQSLKEIHGLFARLEKPVDYQSIDEQPVDLIFLILAPESAGADHLKALARISRVLRNSNICTELRSTDTVGSLYSILTENIQSEVA